MRLFLYELKKIWSWRVLALLAAFAALVWFSILRGDVQTYKTLSHYASSFGPYQREMFDKYGPTLESEELADYDISGKIAALEGELDDWIASDPLFTGNGISTYAEYEDFRSQDRDSMDKEEYEKFSEITMQMDRKLWLDEYWNDPKKQFTSPYVRLGMLSNLNDTYTEYERNIGHYLEYENQPVAVEAARQILAKHNNSLVPYNLKGTASGYSTVVGVFVILATLLLVSPSLTRDRARHIHPLQYSSTVGRRILLIQWAAVTVSACVFSLVAIGASATALLTTDMSAYFGVSMLSMNYGSIQSLYEITFGQYLLLLAVMIVLLSMTAACFAFVLAKFSTNIIGAVLKIVPLGLAFWVLYLSAISEPFDPRNALFRSILHGRVVMPELILCVVLAAAGLLAAVIVAARERKADIL
ncbi:ABC transporter permease [Saccharibacillus deserti]|uniref:ABC transporter permease n=1 Tax=Saccharibacillus deserti TaxID=1634444 RepID=UPI001554DB63|nr:ABC transporter permease [Saccharibacillus deserti]